MHLINYKTNHIVFAIFLQASLSTKRENAKKKRLDVLLPKNFLKYNHQNLFTSTLNYHHSMQSLHMHIIIANTLPELSGYPLSPAKQIPDARDHFSGRLGRSLQQTRGSSRSVNTEESIALQKRKTLLLSFLY